MKICVIVPIKHNSERVPGKNFRDFNGKPLFHIILNTLLKSKYINDIFVDTNSPVVIKSIETDFSNSNITIYERPIELQSGDTPTNILLENIITQMNLQYDYYLQTHVTNPLLSVKTIDKCIETFIIKETQGHDSLFTVKQHQTRLYQCKNESVKALNHNPNELIPTQNLEPIYEENSCLYIFKKGVLFERQHRIGYKPYIYIMNDIESSDIDIESDFVMAEELHKYTGLNKDKVVIVTGVNGDIGQSIVKEFKKYNWITIGIDIKSNTNTKYIDKFICCDISDANKLKEQIDTLEMNVVDCIVNNAATQICKPIWEYEIDEWDYTINSNLRPIFLLTKFCIEMLKKSKNANIINIGSVHATATSCNIAPYACSKAGVVGFTKNLALELGKYNIRVNTISPGAIDTKMLRSGLLRGHVGKGCENVLVEKLSQKHILGNIGSSTDVAKFVYYLITNKFINGSNLIMDGGASISLSTEV
jgi:CMP-N-acetylneuraminic acid synthetase/NAD(P)-dependent dehydrogenase (short-subunit alcohol dehydrogenase family)